MKSFVAIDLNIPAYEGLTFVTGYAQYAIVMQISAHGGRIWLDVIVQINIK